MKKSCTYILCDRPYGALYVGVTSDLPRRIFQHRTGEIKGHTQTRSIHRLVYYEVHDGIEAAIKREKQIKRWQRQWKFNLIERDNPHWDDLYVQLERVGFQVVDFYYTSSSRPPLRDKQGRAGHET